MQKYADSLQINRDIFFTKSKKINSSHVSGKMSSELRKELNNLADSSFDFSLVSNARCLSEGIDVPSLDAIAFIDPRRSIIDIVQAIEEQYELLKTKRKVIFIPIINEDEEISKQLSESSFQQIAKFEALKAHDERLVEELKNLIAKRLLMEQSHNFLTSSLIFQKN